MKYNLSVLKNKNIEFNIFSNDKNIIFSNFVKNVKQTNVNILFIFDNCYLEINKEVFNHMLIRYNEEKNVIILKQDKNKEFLTSFIGFTMFDTYGFPIEMSEEIFEEKGLKIDLEGFYILRKLQKEMSSNTFKYKDVFGNGESL